MTRGLSSDRMNIYRITILGTRRTQSCAVANIEKA